MLVVGVVVVVDTTESSPEIHVANLRTSNL